MKKQDIFNTSLALIVKQGLHATPMSQIARESNVAAGTIYHYFKSKEEMIHELYLRIRQDLRDELIPGEIDANNFRMEFTSFCLRIFKFFIQHPMKFSFLQQYEHSPLGLQSDELEHTAEFPLPIEFFTQGNDLGLLTSIPLTVQSNLVYANMSALVKLQLSEKVALNKEIIQRVIEGCWNMIKK